MASVTWLRRTAVGPLLAAAAGGRGSPAVAVRPLSLWRHAAPMAAAPAAAAAVTVVARSGHRRGLHTASSVVLQRVPGGGDGDGSGGGRGWPRAPQPPWVSPQAAPRGDALRRYTRDLTADANAGRLDPVVGREEEVRLVLQILGRRTKNNPALIGEPGTGKTAIAEGLAARLAAGDAPRAMTGVRVLALDVAALAAGAGIKGEYESRVQALLADLAATPPRSVILFVDELHQLTATGGGSGGGSGGGMTLSEMLKPPLARGELSLLGATTAAEYRRHVEADAALARRFTPVYVAEPSPAATVAILRGLAPRLEAHHGLPIRDAALVTAASVAPTYVRERRAPDAAIDLVDTAAARLRLVHDSRPEVLEDADRAAAALRVEAEALRGDAARGDGGRGGGRGTASAAASGDGGGGGGGGGDGGGSRRLADVERDLAAVLDRKAVLEAAWTRLSAARASVKAAKADLDAARTELAAATRDGRWERASELTYSIIPDLEARAAATPGGREGNGGVPPDDGDAAEDLTGSGQERPVAGMLPRGDGTNNGDRNGSGDGGGRVPGLPSTLGDDLRALRSVGDAVTDADVLAVVSRLTGIPVGRLGSSASQRLLTMEDTLRQSVVGQEPALAAVARAVRLARSGLRAPQRPTGCFLFLGPTGVGKTALAKALASYLYDDSGGSLVRIDLSEYGERHTVSRLLGAPPSYVGYGEGGQLTEPVRRRPYSLLLLDEAEKAAPAVLSVLLQLMDDGVLTDGGGRRVDFCHTLVILTSNVGSALLGSLPPDTPPELAAAKVGPALRAAFSPELLNRFDAIIPFRSLGAADMDGVARVALAEAARQVSASARLHLDWTTDAGVVATVATRGTDAAYGARPVRRLIEREVLGPLSELLLRGKVVAGDGVRVTVERREGAEGGEGEDGRLVLVPVPGGGRGGREGQPPAGGGGTLVDPTGGDGRTG